MPIKPFSQDDYATFHRLYNLYASKLLGFIRTFTETKEQAEEYLEKVFLEVCKDLNAFNSNTEKKLLTVALLICRPAIKSNQNANSKSYSNAL